MIGTEEEFAKATAELKGRKLQIVGDHPFSGDIAEVVSLDRIGMRVRLLCADAMNGHECYVTRPDQYRAIPILPSKRTVLRRRSK